MSPTRFPRRVYGSGTEPDPRFTFTSLLGEWGIGAGILALAVAGMLWALSERRLRRRQRLLVAASGQLPDGRLTLALALTVAGGGSIGLLYLLVAGPGYS